MQLSIAQNMKKKTTKLVIAAAMLVITIIGGMYIFYNENLKPTGSSEDKVILTIEDGATFQDLFNLLDENGLMKNQLVAKLYLKLHKVDGLHVNSYELNKGMSLPEIIDAVTSGDTDYLVKIRVTIPEGLTLPQIAEIVAESCGVSKQEVMDQWNNREYLDKLVSEYWFLNADEIFQDGIKYPLEGYLFPETYTLTTKKPTVDDLTYAMLEMTSQKLHEYEEGMNKMQLTPHEFLTFASIVERESLFDKDRPMIAEAFINRLQQDMPLESDITVLYALERTGVDLSYAEIESVADSPYNTYKRTGLPIGPISSVSDITMKSCVNHADHDYLFFYAGPDGTVYYAKTYDEHLQNVDAYPWPDE